VGVGAIVGRGVGFTEGVDGLLPQPARAAIETPAKIEGSVSVLIPTPSLSSQSVPSQLSEDQWFIWTEHSSGERP
jgi:hypothetical protein